MTETVEKQEPDWPRIEADFRAGIKSLRQIGSEHGVSEGAIRKRAKKEEWTRDLEKRIQAKADELVRNEAVRNTVRSEGDAYRMTTPEKKLAEKEVVEVNAQLQFQVRMQSREDVLRLEKIVRTLMGELEAYTNDRAALEELGEWVAERMDEDIREHSDNKALDKTLARKLNMLYSRVISSSERIDSAKKLVEMLDRLIALKYRIFGIKLDDDAGDKGTVEDLLESIGRKTAGGAG